MTSSVPLFHLGLGEDKKVKYYEQFIALVSILNELIKVQRLFLFQIFCYCYFMSPQQL